MQYITVLGPRKSGKSVLVGSWAQDLDEESSVSGTDPFAVLPLPRLRCCSVLDPKRHSDASSLGRSLARRMPVAVLLTLPRDVESAEAARKEMLYWANVARGHTDRARLALVVTKSDITAPPLDDVPFGRVAYDVLRVTGAEQMFYTEAAKRGPDGVYRGCSTCCPKGRRKSGTGLEGGCLVEKQIHCVPQRQRRGVCEKKARQRSATHVRHVHTCVKENFFSEEYKYNL